MEMLEKYQEIVRNPDKVLALARGEREILLDEAGKRFELEQNLIELSSGQAIFIGDTHGDFDATKKVIAKYLQAENKVIFLGDYVDRGERSHENIDYLLSLKLIYPENLFLLMGNHEAHGVIQFSPADFWEQLDRDLYELYASVLMKLPLAVSTQNGIIALHGALPNIENLEDVNEIRVGTETWRQITWGDWQELSGKFLGDDTFTGRPQFGQDYFNEIMDRFGKNVLIRSHQPTAEPTMYYGRCLTIFTSSVYRPYVSERTVAIVDLEREVKTIDDLAIKTV
jgi:predicted phosphodiesterase